MGFFKKLIILGLLLAGGMYLYGRSLPGEHVARSTIVLVAPADSVFALIRNVGSTPTWWSDMRSSRRLSGYPRETWEEDMGAAGVLHIEITQVSPPRQIVTTIVDTEEAGWGGVWTYDIASSATGTELTITEEGYIDSPIYRVIMKFIGVHRSMDSYLRSLGAHFGEPANPRHG